MLTKANVEPVPPIVSSFTKDWGRAPTGNLATTAPASTAYTANNQAHYYPISVPTVCIAKRMWWVNGATVSGSNNVEAGIYLSAANKPGAKLITTGSVAQGTLNQLQFADITDTTLTPGIYWLYLSCSTTAATFFRAAATGATLELSFFQQAGVGPGSAPSTATPVETANSAVFLFGFSTTTIT